MKKVPQRQFKLDKHFRIRHTKLYAIFLAAVELCRDEWINEEVCPMDAVKKIGKVLYHRTPADCQRENIREYIKHMKFQLLSDIEAGVHIFDSTAELEYEYGKKLACLRELQRFYYEKDGRCSPPRWSDHGSSPLTLTYHNGIVDSGRLSFINDSDSQSPQPAYENIVVTPLWDGCNVSQAHDSVNGRQHPRILSRTVQRTRSSPQLNRTQVTEDVDVIIIDEEEEEESAMSSSSSPIMICDSVNPLPNDSFMNGVSNDEEPNTSLATYLPSPDSSEKTDVSKTSKKSDHLSEHWPKNVKEFNLSRKKNGLLKTVNDFQPERERIIYRAKIITDFICPSCATNFVSEGTLEAHKVFYCPFRIRSADDIEDESEKISSTDSANPTVRKTFACPECLFSSDSKARYTKHARMHWLTVQKVP